MTTRIQCNKPYYSTTGVPLDDFKTVLDMRSDDDFAIWLPLLGDAFNVHDEDSGFWLFINEAGEIKILFREKLPDVGFADVVPTADTFYWEGSYQALVRSLARIDARIEVNEVGDGSAQHLLSIFMSADSATVESQTATIEDALQKYGLYF